MGNVFLEKPRRVSLRGLPTVTTRKSFRNEELLYIRDSVEREECFIQPLREKVKERN